MRTAKALLPFVLIPVLLVGGCKSNSGPSGSPVGTGVTATTDATACPTDNTIAFAKTKFVAHAGLAFGAFHRYIYKPFRADEFRSGARGRFSAFAKAGLAALFIKREVRLASEDAKANPTLCNLIAAPLERVATSVGDAVTRLKGGDVTGVEGVQSAVSGVESSAAGAGTTIQEDANAPIAS